MNVHPIVQQLNGIVSVTIVTSFTGGVLDVTDKQRISAYGDPSINLAGTFTDPADSTFSFSFLSTSVTAGITTTIQNYTARFMTTAIPPPVLLPVQTYPYGYPYSIPGGYNPFGYPSYSPPAPIPFPQYQYSPAGVPSPLDSITPNPVRAATIWVAAIEAAIQGAMTTLRAITPVQLTSLPDSTI